MKTRPLVVSCPICLSLSKVWVDEQENWCSECQEVFPVHINSPEWREWFRRKFGEVL